jgi:hypothetical protein
MKYQKFVIETDGTSMGTKVFVDDKQISLVQRLDFSADVNSTFVQLNVQVGRCVNDVLKKKKVKVRDPKTEAFVEKEEIDCEPLMLERTV